MKDKNLESNIRTKDMDFLEKFERIRFITTVLVFSSFVLSQIGYSVVTDILNNRKESLLNKVYALADTNKNSIKDIEEVYSVADSLGIKVLNEEGEYITKSVILEEISKSSKRELKEYIKKHKNK